MMSTRCKISRNDASSISNFAVSNQTTSGVYTLGVTLELTTLLGGGYNLDIIGNAPNNSIAGNSGCQRSTVAITDAERG